MTSGKLFERIENSTSLDFGDVFSKSFELFKKVWVQGFVHLLISLLVMLPLFFAMYIPLFAIIGIDGFEQNYNGHDDFPKEELSIGLMILFIILVIVITMIAAALQFAITAHFYRVCKQVDHGLPGTSSYFMFLKGKYIGKVFTIAIASFGIALLAALLCYLPIFYVMVPLQLLGVMFAFNPDVNTSDLIKASFKLGNKIWLVAFGLILISSILSQLVGTLLCFVGIFLTASFVHMPVYHMYKDTIGFEDDGTEKDPTLFVK
ncbi:hypothetical protein [Aquimarina celericrescens]|uniref:Glycerophosphoryl diester phosphodiesterase membrane domain-containing protein n=1 Tax=Aquimarina celericrescens TaxID=1964542 RepID=A0ABW5AUM3_9FLAO|nr:hypothetical protein [Aquimarina celericrescens]